MNGQWFSSFGYVIYKEGGWVSLRCSSDLAKLYLSQIKEKSQCLMLPMHGCHITICNGKLEKPDMSVWKKHNGRKIWFKYNNQIIQDKRFYWLAVSSYEIIRIRRELGLQELKSHKYLKRGLHITLARKQREYNV
jgi:hypothetical protein